MNIKLCKYDGCDGKSRTLDYCQAHYQQLWSKSKLKPIRRITGKNLEVADKIRHYSKITESGCWEWNHTTGKNGYGRLYITGASSRLAHRLSYEIFIGELGKESIHHMCNNKSCVNPEHLQKVTQRENMAEMFERSFYINTIKKQEEIIKQLSKQIESLGGVPFNE